jgi:hypothetical protein
VRLEKWKATQPDEIKEHRTITDESAYRNVTEKIA